MTSSRENEDARFRSLDFTAYVTDISTGRTEQRPFTLRISEAPIHIYFIGSHFGNIDDRLDFYLATFTADGRPISCDVTIRRAPSSDTPRGKDGEVLRQVRTNRYGVAKVAPLSARGGEALEELDVTARDDRGRTGHGQQRLRRRGTAGTIRVETGRTIHRPGDPIAVQIQAPPAIGRLIVDVATGMEVLRSEVVTLSDGVGSVTFPYESDFGGALTVVAYPVEDNVWLDRKRRPVLYPFDNDQLRLSVRADRDGYRPGDEAEVRFTVRTAQGRPVESILGVVVVDEGLLGLDRTDGASPPSVPSGRFDEELGGVTKSELEYLDLAKPIPEGLDLVAEILFRSQGHFGGTSRTGHYRTNASRLFDDGMQAQLAPVEKALDELYPGDSYPETHEALRAAIREADIDIESLLDPWEMPYRLELESSPRVTRLQVMTAKG